MLEEVYKWIQNIAVYLVVVTAMLMQTDAEKIMKDIFVFPVLY